MVKASFLKEFGGTLELTDRWARDSIDSMVRNKVKARTGKTKPLPQFLLEEQFLFQRPVSTNVLKHDILTFNLNEVPLGKYTFNFRGAKNVSINRVDDKRQITRTLAVTLHGKTLPIQLIYQGKSRLSLPKFNFRTLSPLVLQKNTGRIPLNK